MTSCLAWRRQLFGYGLPCQEEGFPDNVLHHHG